MRLLIRARHMEWTPEVRKHVERSIDSALDRYKQRLTGVSAYLADVNGPKGGVDTLCQITVTLRGSARPISILERGTDIVPAIYRATRRLRNRIAASIRRIKNHRKTIPNYGAQDVETGSPRGQGAKAVRFGTARHRAHP